MMDLIRSVAETHVQARGDDAGIISLQTDSGAQTSAHRPKHVAIAVVSRTVESIGSMVSGAITLADLPKSNRIAEGMKCR